MARINPYIKSTGEVIMSNNFPVGDISQNIPSDYFIYYPFIPNYTTVRNWFDAGSKLITNKVGNDGPLYGQAYNLGSVSGISSYSTGPSDNLSGSSYFKIFRHTGYFSGYTWSWTASQYNTELGYSVWLKNNGGYRGGIKIAEVDAPQNGGDILSYRVGDGISLYDSTRAYMWCNIGLTTTYIPFNNNQWNHYAYTRDLNYHYFYHNGSLVHQIPWTPRPDSIGPWTYGVDLCGWLDQLNQIDAFFTQLIIYRRFLTATEILSIYENQGIF